MEKNNALGYVTTFFLGIISVVLVLYVWQLNNIEERSIRQSKQFQEMAESNDRLRGELRRLVTELRTGVIKVGSGNGNSGSTGGTETAESQEGNYLEPHNFQPTLPEADMTGRLVRAYGSEPKGFNVMIENAADLQENVWTYVGTQFASRMAWTEPDKWYGRVARRVEISDDKLKIKVYLKKGIKWHRPSVDLSNPTYQWMQGDHYLTTEDVAFSFGLLKNPQVQNGFMKNYYKDLEGWEVIDDHTIVIKWSKPYYGAIEQTLAFPILPKWFYSRSEDGTKFSEETLGLKFNDHWYNNKGLIGTGPYRFDYYEPGGEVRLVRNEDYHGELPAIKEIVMPIYSDPNQTLLRLKAHKMHVGGLRPSQYRDLIEQWQDKPKADWPEDNKFLNGQIHHKKYIAMVYYYLGWNADKKIFADRRVRWAMTHAFDRQRIIDHVFVGLGKIATGPFFSESPYNDPTIEPIPFDLDKAAALLKEVGWEDTDGDGLLDKDLTPDDGNDTRTPFEFSFLIYANSPEYTSLANIFKEDLLKIGVRMKIEAVEWSLMQKKMNEKKFDAYTGGWGLTWDPDPYQLWHSSQADIPKGSNRVAFRNDRADELIEGLRRTFDKKKRLKMLRELHRIIHREQPYTFFRVPEAVACWWDEVERVKFSKIRPHSNSRPWYVDTEQR